MFKVIFGYEDYAIDENGVIKALPKIREGRLDCLIGHKNTLCKSKRKYKERILKQTYKARYMYVQLYNKSGKSKNFRVHRLVYETFKGNIPDGKVIDHIDGNPLNNNVNNLRCVTISENRLNPNTSWKQEKPVLQIDIKTNEVVRKFKSIKEAMKFFGSSDKPGIGCHIGEVCNNKRNSCYGYKWKFEN